MNLNSYSADQDALKKTGYNPNKFLDSNILFVLQTDSNILFVLQTKQR